MNRIKSTFSSIIFWLLVILSVSQNSLAQWQQTNGPYGGQVNCFAVSGTNIFAGTPVNGVYFSSDNGTNWDEMSNGLSDLNVRALCVSGWNLFAGTPSGVFYSTDNGTSWTDVSTGLTNTDVYSLTISGTDLFAGTADGGVFLSTDNGTNWTNISIGSAGDYVRVLAMIGINLFAGTDGSGLYRSTDNGMNWAPANGILENYIRAIVSNGNGSIFVGAHSGITTPGVVYRSENGGNSWYALNNGFAGAGHLLSMTVSGPNIFAGTGELGNIGVYLISDVGIARWRLTSLTDLMISSLAVIGNEVFAGTEVSGHIGAPGVFLTYNNGTKWTDINNGMINTNVQTFAADNTYLYTGTYSGVFYSADGGMNWESTPWHNVTSTLTINSAGIFAVSGGGIYLSTDNGSSWSFAGSLNAAVVAMVSIGTDLYAGTTSLSYGDVWRSTDNAETWTQTGLTDANVYSLAVSNSTLYAAVHQLNIPNNAVLFSTDNGTTWANITTGLPNQQFRVLVTNGTNLFTCTGSNGGIWFTSDNGTNWTDISIPSISAAVSSIIISGTNLFAGTRGGGVFVSTDSGNNWFPINTGLTNLKVPALFISGSNLLAGTNASGVWSHPLSEMLSKSTLDHSQEVPDQFSLEQNYPNPFNPSTTIRYNIPKSGQVKLSVYNLLGEEVALLVNDFLEAGFHEVSFNAANQPSGTYFYKIESGGMITVKKMVLVK